MPSQNMAKLGHPGTTKRSGSTSNAGWARFGSAWSRAGRGSLRSIELLLRPGTNFVELRVKPSDFGIQFDEIQAGGRDKLLTRAPRVIARGVRFHADTSRGPFRRRIGLQEQEIETRCFHDAVIIPRIRPEDSTLISTISIFLPRRLLGRKWQLWDFYCYL